MKNIFPDLVCIQPTCSQACLARSDAIILFFCLVLHVLNSECSLCEACRSLLSICQALSLSFLPILPPRGPPTLSLSAPPHIYSSFLHWVDDSLVFESCAFCSMICSVVSLLLPGVSLFLLLLHPGSQPTLTYVSASHVLIFQPYKTVSLLSISSPELFVTLLDTPKRPVPLPQTFVSLHPTLCDHPHHPWQDFLGQVHCTLGEIVGSPASRLEKSLG